MRFCLGNLWIQGTAARVANFTSSKVADYTGKMSLKSKVWSLESKAVALLTPDSRLQTSDSSLVNQERVARLFFHARRTVIQLIYVEKDFDKRGLAEMSLNQRFRERVFDMFLQGAAKRARAVGTIRAGLIDEPALGLIRQANFKAAILEGAVHLFYLQLHHVQQLVVQQLVEDDDFVQAVDELRIEGL